MASGPVAVALGVGLAAVHVVGHWIRDTDVIPRRWWLSVGSGVSVAYVFVHLVPELTARQFRAAATMGPPESAALPGREHVLFLAVLAGFVTYYGIELLVRRSQRRREAGDVVAGARTRTSRGIFWVHVGSFAAYNLLVGYLLVGRSDADSGSVFLFAAAIAMHLIVNDYGLYEHHREAYRHVGRWVLAAAVLGGVVVGFLARLPELSVSLFFAFLAGGIILNVIKEELPEERQSRFLAFAVGVIGYTAVLLLL